MNALTHSIRPIIATLALLTVAAAPATAAEGLQSARGFELGGGEQCLEGKLERDEAYAAASDETTGRNLRNFPPDRVVDYKHMKLEMRFDTLEERRFTAIETLTVTPIGTPATSVTLDAVGLDIKSARIGARTAEFFQSDEHVTVRFDPPLALGEDHDIVFEYVCDHPYAGLFFTPASETIPTYTSEVHTQGQTITNRHWFIAHDSPNERMSTELIVDVPAEYTVSANGRLVSNLTNDGRAMWHWLQEQPHVSYLVSLVIGQFDIVEIPHERVAMKVWVPRGLGDRVMASYGMTGGMIDVFERRFGVPYPFDRYDQLVVKNFGAGGMENTSATTMYPTAILDEVAIRDADLEGLIAHELAHQWSGDMLTCKEWSHIWLNEGFATYGSALWREHREGEDGYLDAIRRSMRVARRDRTTDEQAMVSPVYDHPSDNFRRRGNPYPKGSSILHMLRRMLGEDVFWSGMHLYMSRHALDVVETDDFRYALEEVSGRGLEWFFDQWCYRPGSPNLDVSVAYDGERRELEIEVEQTQHIDDRTPAFRFTLPVQVRTASGDRVLEIDVSERHTSFRAALDGVPGLVAVDPHLDVLCTLDVDKPASMWPTQLTDGPTIVARVRAIEALGASETPDHRALLARVAGDAGLPRTLRNTAIAELADYESAEAKAEILALLDAGIEDPRVRVKAVETLERFEADEVVDRLATIASSDASYATRVAAIEGLAKHEATAQADLIVELVGFESQHDAVRRAALSALADLDDERGLDLAIRYSAYGYQDRARPAAIAAIGKLADHDTDRAVETLLGLLDDPCRRPAGAAGRALANIGDQRALARIEAIAEKHPDPRRRTEAERWLTTLKEKAESGDATASAG